MLNSDPNERISSKEALLHAFFNKCGEEQKSDIKVYKKTPRPSILSRLSTDDFDK